MAGSNTPAVNAQGANSSDEEDILNSQDRRDVFTNIRDKFGHLTKDDFKRELVKTFKDSDLLMFRQSLYDYAVKYMSDTPEATLVVRKFQQGGPTLKSKLSDDIFIIFHYIQGDMSVDITKLFPDREKVRLRKEAQNSSDLCSTEERDGVHTADLNKTMLDFCRDFLVEMRKSRDELGDDIKDIKRDTAMIRNLRLEIAEMRQSAATLASKVDTLESQLKSKSKHLDKVTERCRLLETEVEQMQQKQSDRYISLRENVASTTQRLNIMQMAQSSSPKATPAVNPMGTPFSAMLSKSGSPELSSGVATSVSGLPATLTMAAHISDKGASPTLSTSPRSANYSLHGVMEPDTAQTFVKPPVSDTVGSNQLVSTSTTTATKPRVLKGFIPRARRPSLGAVYLAGIIADDDDAATVAMLRAYLTDHGVDSRAVRVIKHKGNTVAAKIVLQVQDVDKILEKFWPEGIHARKWNDDER